MKTIYRIARVELSTLFYSPVAWLILIIFTFQSGLTFADVVKWPLAGQEAGNPQAALTFGIFQNLLFGFFKTITGTLYLYIPLLTMGVMSREISSGSIKLLLSAPVRIREIIGGKFLAMMIYNLLIIGILFLVVLCGWMSIAHLDVKALLSGLLGIYLLICTYSAIGLFMSSLTSYQVVAAMGTLAVLAVLNYVREVWQGNDLYRRISYFLSLAGRVESFFLGLLTTTAFLYFVLVSVFFLSLTTMRLNDGRTARTALVRTGRYLLLTIVIILIGYASSIPLVTGYYDMTVNKALTLTPEDQAVVAAIKRPIKVTAYINLLDPFRMFVMSPERRNGDLDYWQTYTRFIPDLELDYRYYYDTTADFFYRAEKGQTLEQIGKKSADAYGWDMSMFLPPSRIRSEIDLEPEGRRGVRRVEAGGRSTFLRLYDEPNPNPGEAEMIAAFKRLQIKAPRIGFLTGQYERDITRISKTAYKPGTTNWGSRAALINQGFDVVAIDTLEGRDLPADITALVIADPRRAFRPAELEKLQQYLNRGGNMVIAGEPGKQSVLNPLLSLVGVKMMDGVLIEYSKDYSPDYLEAHLTADAAKISYRFARLFKDSTKMIIDGAVGLEYKGNSGFAMTPLVVTDEKNTWNKTGEFAMDTGKVTFNPEHGDVKAPIPVALALTRPVGKKQQRILVFGDADWFSTQYFPDPLRYWGNYNLGHESFHWIDDEIFPIDVKRPETLDTRFTIDHDDLKVIRIVFLGVIPGIFLITGVIVLIRRKRK